MNKLEDKTTYVIDGILRCKKCDSKRIIEVSSNINCDVTVIKDMNKDEIISETVENIGDTDEYEYKCQNCDAHISYEEVGEWQESE